MAGPAFRRGDVVARRYQVATKSGETSLWVGYHAFDQGNANVSANAGVNPGGEVRNAIPEPDVLLKVVKPELLPDAAARAQLVRDLARMKGLQHPGMPRLLDAQLLEEQNTVVLIEPIQAGLSQGVLLRRMVTFRQKERFPLAEVRQIGAQLASALSYIHGQMLCHGDLRLETVLLRPDGAKLCDIGLGAALPRPLYLEAVKKANELDLLAPELKAGRPADARSDVYGLAALYRYLLSLGQDAAWQAFVAEKPAMAHVLGRGMHEEPPQRYASIEMLIADIEAVALTGAPIRKRLAPTPLAMAVAAGRLPAEELNRPVDEILPDSARSKRNSLFETGVVLTQSGAPSAKMSIGTIPPTLTGPQSARSGRLPTSGNSAESGQSERPGGAGKGGPASASSKGGPASASSKGGPASASSKGGPASASSKGGPASASSKGPKGSGRSVPPPADGTETGKPSATSKGEGKVPTDPGLDKKAEPGAAAASGTGTTNPGVTGPSATGTTNPGVTGPGATKNPTNPGAAGPGAFDGRTSSPAVAVSSTSAGPRSSPGEPVIEGEFSSRATGPIGRKSQISAGSEVFGDDPGKKRSSPADRITEKLPPSGRSTRTEPPSTRSKPSEPPSSRSRSSDGAIRSGQSMASLPPSMLVTSRLALVGALLLAALVGALVAVAVMLLLRPAAMFGPPSVTTTAPPSVASPATGPLTSTPGPAAPGPPAVEPSPSASATVTIVPVTPEPNTAASKAPRPPLPLRLADEPEVPPPAPASLAPTQAPAPTPAPASATAPAPVPAPVAAPAASPTPATVPQAARPSAGSPAEKAAPPAAPAKPAVAAPPARAPKVPGKGPHPAPAPAAKAPSGPPPAHAPAARPAGTGARQKDPRVLKPIF